jgi:hypothetical protein
MKNLTWIALLAAGMGLGLAAPALSHHSHAMFDHDQELTLTGTVTVMSFRNPHVFLYVDVEEENGETVNYWIEMSNLPNMIRRGIGVNTFKPGDVITVHMHPLKDGRPGGSYTTVVAADGITYD